MLNKYLKIISLVLILFNNSYGQYAKENDLITEALDNTIMLYKNSMKENMRIYNGIEYINYDKGIEGHQYFGTDSFTEGDILYDGILYKHITMLYDIVKDQLIIKHFNGGYNVIIPTGFVSEFYFTDHSFIKIADTLNAFVTGYYDRIYHGKIDVIVKRNKSIEEIRDNQHVYRNFLEHNYYYLFTDGRYYQIKNKSSLLKIFDKRRRDMLHYIRENKMKFNKTFEIDLVKSAAYYDSQAN